MGFSQGFEKVALDKEAFIAPLLGAIGRAGAGAIGGLARTGMSAARLGGAALRPVGQGLSRAGAAGIRGAARVVGGAPGPMGYVGLGLTGMQGVSEFGQNKAKMTGALR